MHIKKIYGIIFLVALSVAIYSPPALAQGLVPCGPGVGVECTVCHFLVLIKNIIDFLTKVSFILVTIMLLYGAFMFFIAGGQEQRIRQGREIITTALFGLVIVLTSWIIINTLIQIFVNPAVIPSPWNTINC